MIYKTVIPEPSTPELLMYRSTLHSVAKQWLSDQDEYPAEFRVERTRMLLNDYERISQERPPSNVLSMLASYILGATSERQNRREVEYSEADETADR